MKLSCVKLLGIAGVVLALSCLTEAHARTLVRKPNVILILTDDQGSVDAGCYGAADLITPAIDSLAKSGVRFTQFYAAAPVCSPSRAGLLTGRYPLRAKLTTNASSQPGGTNGLPASEVTIAEMLKAAGYATAHIGKWHLGYRAAMLPQAQGFDHSFGHMGGCIDNYSHFFFWQGANRHDLHRNGKAVFADGQFFPDLMASEASRFIEQNKNQPFFLYLALNMPHYPYQGDNKWLNRYKHLPYPRNLYAAFVSTLDERIGQLLKKVDRLGLLERTIVIFQSDHGHSTEDRAHSGGGGAGPYRGAKFSLFEGGIRVPAIISWPGRLPKGEVRTQLAHSCDWLPTIAELCNVPLLNPDVDGKSLVPVARSASAPTPHEVVHWNDGPRTNAQWAVRHGDWKLIGNARDTNGDKLTDEDKKLFLTNLAQDVSEQTNLAKAQPDILRRMLKLREDWISAQTE
ncbi:MAG: DUF229 domain-containing protein [Verrucomicrobia bacterium]|nr:DUF229 domain-containing protein [Verrucomicrobiota bacterium]